MIVSRILYVAAITLGASLIYGTYPLYLPPWDTPVQSYLIYVPITTLGLALLLIGGRGLALHKRFGDDPLWVRAIYVVAIAAAVVVIILLSYVSSLYLTA